MKKKICAIIGGVLLTSLVLGCSGGSKDINAGALAESLKSGIVYQDDLTDIGLDTAQMIYNFDDATIEEAYIYESSGATAEEIVVIKCATNEDVAKIRTAFDDRIVEQKESYEDYVPEELTKIDAAVIYTDGVYAVLSVSDEPDKAKGIIEASFK